MKRSNKSPIYICNKNGSGIAKIGDLFMETPGGWQRMKKILGRSSVHGQMSTKYVPQTDGIIIPYSALQAYVIQVKSGYLSEK